MVYYDCQDWTESGYSEATVINRFNNMGDQKSEFTSIFNTHLHDTEYYKKADSDAKFWNFTVKAGDYDKLDGYEGVEILNLGLLLNGIYLWGGEFANIPAVFELCDGFNDTPNLVGRQLVGAGNAYNVGVTGGSESVTPSGSITINNHTLTTAEIPAHYHAYVEIYNSLLIFEDPFGKVQNTTLAAVQNKTTASEGGDGAHNHTGSFTGNAYEKSGLYIKLPFIKKTS